MNDVPPSRLAVGVPAKVIKDLRAAEVGKVQAEEMKKAS